MKQQGLGLFIYRNVTPTCSAARPGATSDLQAPYGYAYCFQTAATISSARTRSILATAWVPNEQAKGQALNKTPMRDLLASSNTTKTNNGVSFETGETIVANHMIPHQSHVGAQVLHERRSLLQTIVGSDCWVGGSCNIDGAIHPRCTHTCTFAPAVY